MTNLILLAIVSWVIGIAVYLISLTAFFGQTISIGDLVAVLFWSFFASLVVFPTVYAPCLFVLRRFLKGCRPAFWFPLVASLLGLIPTFLIVLSQGGRIHDLLSSEALLFYCMFIAVGVVFGLGFVNLYRQARKIQKPPQPKQPESDRLIL